MHFSYLTFIAIQSSLIRIFTLIHRIRECRVFSDLWDSARPSELQVLGSLGSWTGKHSKPGWEPKQEQSEHGYSLEPPSNHCKAIQVSPVRKRLPTGEQVDTSWKHWLLFSSSPHSLELDSEARGWIASALRTLTSEKDVIFHYWTSNISGFRLQTKSASSPSRPSATLFRFRDFMFSV